MIPMLAVPVSLIVMNVLMVLVAILVLLDIIIIPLIASAALLLLPDG